jgi:hypothetical protein
MFGHRQAGQVAELSAQGRLARAATTEYQHPSHALMMPARTAATRKQLLHAVPAAGAGLANGFANSGYG